MSEVMYYVKQEQHATDARERIWHEIDGINNRSMWQIIGKGFITNAFATAEREVVSTDSFLIHSGDPCSVISICDALKRYQVREYLLFPCNQAT